MEISSEGIKLIKGFEGLRLNAYRDAVGVLTIGYGHTKNVEEGQQITEEEAEALLKSDLEIFEDSVLDAVNVPITQHQFDALVSFTYNLGARNFRNSTLLKKLNAEDYEGAANEFLRWNRAGGRVLNGLTRRRAAERDLFLLY